MKQHVRVTHPPCSKAWRPVVAHLRDTDGCRFEPASGKLKVYNSAGNYVATISGVHNGSEPTPGVLVALRRKGVLATYGNGAAVAAETTGGTDVGSEAVNTNEPVRPHTAHQYRLDHVRQRTMRALLELGGNTTEVRKEFCVFALEEAAKVGLPLPQPGRLGGKSTALDSFRSSMGAYLQGKGLGQRNLDIVELAVQLLEKPRARVVPARTVAATAAATTEVAPGIAHMTSPGSKLLYHSPRAESQSKEVAVTVTPPAAVPPQDVAAAAAGVAWQATARQAYMDALVERAAAGDVDARDRLERYLGLGQG